MEFILQQKQQKLDINKPQQQQNIYEQVKYKNIEKEKFYRICNSDEFNLIIDHLIQKESKKLSLILGGNFAANQNLLENQEQNIQKFQKIQICLEYQKQQNNDFFGIPKKATKEEAQLKTAQLLFINQIFKILLPVKSNIQEISLNLPLYQNANKAITTNSIKNFIQLICQFKNLEKLFLNLKNWGWNNKQIEKKDVSLFTQILDEIKSLKSFGISLCQWGFQLKNVDPDSLMELIKGIKNYGPQLKELTLDLARIGTDIYEGFRIFKSEHIYQITEMINANKQLKKLKLNLRSFSYSNNKISNDSLCKLFDSLQNLKNLTQLELNFSRWAYNNNQIKVTSLNHLANSLKNLENIEIFGLNLKTWDNIEDEKGKYLNNLVSSIFNLKKLVEIKKLKIQYHQNNIRQKVINYLLNFNDFHKIKSLKFLQLQAINNNYHSRFRKELNWFIAQNLLETQIVYKINKLVLAKKNNLLFNYKQVQFEEQYDKIAELLQEEMQNQNGRESFDKAIENVCQQLKIKKQKIQEIEQKNNNENDEWEEDDEQQMEEEEEEEEEDNEEGGPLILNHLLNQGNPQLLRIVQNQIRNIIRQQEGGEQEDSDNENVNANLTQEEIQNLQQQNDDEEWE